MRTLNVVLAAALLVTGIVTVHLWRELRVERTLNAELQAQSRVTAALHQPALASVRDLPATPVADVTGRSPTSEAAMAAAPVRAMPLPANRQQSMRIEAELMRNPEYRKGMVAQIRASLPQQFPGAVDDLGLNAHEAEQLYELLAEQHVDGLAVNQTLLDGRPADSTTIQQRRQAQAEVERRFEQQLSTLFGEPRVAQWKEYQTRKGAYQEATQVTQMLAQAGQAPLTPDQTRAMRAAYAAMAPMSGANVPGNATSVDRTARMEQQLKLQTERSVKIIEAAERNLSVGQADAVRTALLQRNNAAKASIQLMQLRAQAQRDAGAPTP